MLKIQKFVVTQFLENTFVVFDSESKKGFLIDPGMADTQIDDFIENSKIQIEGIYCTHCHPDHIAGVKYFQKQYKAPFYVHGHELSILEAYPMWAPMLGFDPGDQPRPDGYVKDGQSIEVGQYHFKVIPTPGHTPGGICLHCQSQKLLFSGDTLFHRSVGRTDFPGGNTDQLITSIQENLFTLPEDTLVYCGHGDETKIGEEKDMNPFVGNSQTQWT